MVGFYKRKKIMNKISEIRDISERLCFVKMKIGKDSKLLIIQVYAPVSNTSEVEIDEFSWELVELLNMEKFFFFLNNPNYSTDM